MVKARYTRKMIEAQERVGEPLAQYIAEHIAVDGYDRTALLLGTSKGALAYWMFKLGIEIHHVALLPGEALFHENTRGERIQVA
jgi:hypothetical protein